ncbi:MAG: hypothetical protein CMG69_06235, partial [Candidatus Marinimicrobia bacterium]|nr:hypothetical protein [Candidatus Neomarinimicrobiota bacterium]
DEDADNITYTAQSDTVAISTFITGSVLTMTPVDNFNGTSTISVTASDGTDDSGVETFVLTITPVNDAPILVSISDQTTAEDTPLAVSLSASDVDGDLLTYSAVSNTEDIAISITGSELTLTPSSNFNGSGIINVTANDGTVSSNTVTFTITVISINDAPVLASIPDQTIAEDQSVSVSLSATDEDADNITYTAQSDTEFVTVFVIGSLLNIIPNENFNGTATISVTAYDGTDDSGVETFVLTITPVNDAPVLDAISNQVTPEDTPLTVMLSASDVDGDSLTFNTISTSGYIEVSVEGSILTVTPTQDFNGNGIIIVSANDGVVESNTVTFTLTVTSVNDAPVLASIPDQTIAEDQSLTLSLSATDVDGDNVSYFAEINTDFVIIYVIGSLLNIIPNENFNGTAIISVTASDGTDDSGVETFVLTVTPMNDAPVLDAISNQITPEDTPLSIILSASDVDGDSLSFSAISTTGNIIVTVIGSILTFTPEDNFNGNGIIIVSANDGTVESNTVTFTLIVTAVNDAPVLEEISDHEILEDQSLSISMSASDVDGDNLTYSVESDTVAMTVILNGNILILIPDENFNGIAVITASVNDGTENSNLESFILTVIEVNDAPGDFMLLAPDNNAIIYISEDTDLNDGLTFTWEEAENVDGDMITYSWIGTDSFEPLNSLGVSLDTNSITIPYQQIWQILQDSSLQTITGTWTITATDGEFNIPAQSIFALTIDATALSVLSVIALPETFTLYQNYPNPFNPATFISYDLPKKANVIVSIYSLAGQLVRQFNPGTQEPGHYSLYWNGLNNLKSQVSAGVYIYQIQADKFVQSKKMMLVK